ncbi:MAG: hypothetical protein FJ276_29620, partial [Planctomycetes bacterium]|nr:hypothetical protein [Planctomycetota bacterium]
MATQRHDKNDHFEVVEKLRSDFLKRESPLLVTMNATPIKAVFHKLGDVLQSRITTGTATEKALALEIQNKIKPDLLDDEIRAGIIDGLFQVAQASIQAALILAKGKKLSSEVLPHLLRILTEQHRFEPALAKERLDQFLKSEGYVIEDDPVVWPRLAELVTDLTAEPWEDGVKLSFIMPSAAGADAVEIVRRTAGGAETRACDPMRPTPASRHDWYDREAEIGQRYTYRVFSHLDGRRSSASVDVGGYRQPPPVCEPSVRAGVSDIHINWTLPDRCRGVLVVRTLGPLAKPLWEAGKIVIPPDGESIPHGELNSCTDSSVVPGTTYRYHLVADYGAEIYAKPVSLAAAVSRARPVTNLKATSLIDGVRLTWTLPTGACDRLIVVRGESHVPTGPEDGKVIHRGPPLPSVDDTDIATPGKKHAYCVFSVCDGLIGASVPHCTGYRLRPAPRLKLVELTAAGVLGVWESSVDLREAEVYRAWDAEAGYEVVNGSVLVPDGAARVNAVKGKQFLDTEYQLGRTYQYTLIGRFPDGTYTAPATKTLTLPDPLQPPKAREPRSGDGFVQVEWEPTADRVEGYRLYRVPGRTDTLPEGSEPIHESPACEFPDTSVVVGTTVTYFVRSYTRAIASEPARLGTVTAICELREFWAEALPNAVRLHWIPPDGVDQVAVARQTPSGDWQPSQLFEADQRTWLDREFAHAGHVNYRVKLRFGDTWSEGKLISATPADALPSLPESPRLAPGEVTNVKWERTGAGIRVSWTVPDGALGVLARCVESREQQVVAADVDHCDFSPPAGEDCS